MNFLNFVRFAGRGFVFIIRAFNLPLLENGNSKTVRMFFFARKERLVRYAFSCFSRVTFPFRSPRRYRRFAFLVFDPVTAFRRQTERIDNRAAPEFCERGNQHFAVNRIILVVANGLVFRHERYVDQVIRERLRSGHDNVPIIFSSPPPPTTN